MTHHPTEIPPPGVSAAVDRARVLRYPDLAQKLCEPPLRYARPDQWSGFIPPDTCGQQLNTSTRRGALAELAQEAYERDLAGGTWTPPLDLPTDHQEPTAS
jgi:hypothetical protein